MPDQLTVGTEVEYPRVQNGEDATTFKQPAHGSGDVRSMVRDDYDRDGWPDGFVGSDPTAGLELRSDPMSPEELDDWYRMSIAELSKYKPHEPCGITANSGASTIGLHLHISPLTESQAEALYDMSTEPWFRIFACSSIAESDAHTTFQLFRNSYCRMEFDNDPHRSSNDCVTYVDEHEQHWEWRLLEPVTPDHFSLVMEFVRKLSRDPMEARTFARNLVDNADPRLTAIKRAERIGIVDKVEEEGETEPVERYDVARRPLNTTVPFYESVANDSHSPYIYGVEDSETNNDYYVMYTENYDETDDPFLNNGVEYTHDSVLDGETLTEVTGDEVSDLREAVRQTRQGIDHTDSPTKTEATDALVERLNGAVATDGGERNV